MKIKLTLNSKGLVDRIERTDETTWLNLEKPTVPDVLLPLTHNTKAVTQDIKVIPVSGQQWQNLTQNEKEELLELVEVTGVRAEDYVRLFQSMLPKDHVRRSK